jgi:hypothetical protein
MSLLALPLFTQVGLTEQSKVAIDGIGPVRVGMTIAEAEKSAGVQLIEKGGHYLTLMPKDVADKNYRVVFEALNDRVTQFRSGQVPEVEYMEGCA